jgi:hypothetical protein
MLRSTNALKRNSGPNLIEPEPVSELLRLIWAIENDQPRRADTRRVTVRVDGEEQSFNLQLRTATRRSCRNLAQYLHRQPTVSITAVCHAQGVWECFGFETKLPNWLAGKEVCVTFRNLGTSNYEVLFVRGYRGREEDRAGERKVEVEWSTVDASLPRTGLTLAEIATRLGENPAYFKHRHIVTVTTPSETVDIREGQYSFPGERVLLDYHFSSIRRLVLESKFTSDCRVRLGDLEFTSHLFPYGAARVSFYRSRLDQPLEPRVAQFFLPGLLGADNEPLILATLHIQRGILSTKLSFEEVVRDVVPEVSRCAAQRRDAGVWRYNSHVLIDGRYHPVPDCFGGIGSLLHNLLTMTLKRESSVTAKVTAAPSAETRCLNQNVSLKRAWAGRDAQVMYGHGGKGGRRCVTAMSLLCDDGSGRREVFVSQGSPPSSDLSISEFVLAVNRLKKPNARQAKLTLLLDGQVLDVNVLPRSHTHWRVLGTLVKRCRSLSLIDTVPESGSGAPLGLRFGGIHKRFIGYPIVLHSAYGKVTALDILTPHGEVLHSRKKGLR